MYLINEQYFTQDVYIPNLNELVGDIKTNFENYIEKYVRLFLENTIGYDEFKVFDSNVVGGGLRHDAPQKYKDLLNGHEYTYNGSVYKWKGLVYSDANFKYSMMAKFVFYHYLIDEVSKLTGTGEKVIEANNAISVNSTQRLTTVWNDFVKEYQGICNNGYSFMDFINDVPFYNYRGIQEQSQYVSLVTYLSHQEDFNKLTPLLYEVKNQFGL